MSDETTMEKAWNWIKLAAAIGCVAVFCNGLLVKAHQSADLAGELKTMFENTNERAAETNQVIDWAAGQ